MLLHHHIRHLFLYYVEGFSEQAPPFTQSYMKPGREVISHGKLSSAGPFKAFLVFLTVSGMLRTYTALLETVCFDAVLLQIVHNTVYFHFSCSLSKLVHLKNKTMKMLRINFLCFETILCSLFCIYSSEFSN